MSFSSEYIEYKKKKKQREEQQKLLQKQLKQQKLPQKAATQKKDIGPVPKKEQGDWVSAGLFDDGYQFGDILRTIGGTALDLVGNVAGGALEIGEGVVDAAAYIVGGAGELFGAKDFAKDTKKFIANDLYNGEEVANRILSLGLVGAGGHDEASLLGEKLDSIAQSGGQLAGNLAITAATGGAVPWWLTTGVTSFGQATQEAFNEGADYAQAGASGLISAGAEILTEKLFGGSGLREKGLFNLDGLTKGISNKFVKAVLDLGVDMAAEGTEEFFSSVISKFGDAIVKEKNPFELITDEKAIEEYIDSFIGGAILGGIMNTGKVNKARAKKGGRDYRTGLTATEEKVFNKAYEAAISDRSKGGKELTKKEKAEIYDGVMDDLRKGRVSTGAIEEILGGDSYKAYKDAVDKDNATIKELQGLYEGKELEQKIKDILDNSGRNELKKKLSDEVFGLAKEEGFKMKDRGSFLAESYYEQERGSQKFEADLSQYDEKYRNTVQKAVDSGILNNKRSTHEMVDLFAKLSADKGVEIDFTDNEKIKGTSFAVEGKTVNGYVDKNGNITVNVESPKYLNSIVGHEITHILEGTDLYEALQKEITAYAESKGEYNDRLRDAISIYEGVDGYKGADGHDKIKREVVADLVGDYLFTDANFVRNLHNNNRNLFQKIYDEIKYLCKIATAGSKESRQLESVKRAFEKAYQDGSKRTSDKTRFSMSGEKSLLDNKQSLAKAEMMLEDGVDSETVRQETGWFKGYDGKWRYEIDDSKMFVSRMTLNEIGNIVSYGNLVEHDILFEAYPHLRDLVIEFRDIPQGHGQGYFVHNGNKIVVDKSLKNNVDELKSVLIHETQHAIQEFEGFTPGADGKDFFIYLKTAGEIEAYDVGDRLNYNTEQRKRERPDIDRDDVVFADEVTATWLSKNEAKYDPETATLKEQIINAQETLNKRNVVASVNYGKRQFKNKEDAKKWVRETLSKWGGQVDRQNFGIIFFSKSDIDYAIEHISDPYQQTAFGLLPYVLKRGDIIGEHNSHKLRGKHTITIGAPVEINGTRGNMGVVVNMNGRHAYSARVLLPDGSAFVFSDDIEKTSQGMHQGVPKNESLADTTSEVSDGSIPQDRKYVKSYSLSPEQKAYFKDSVVRDENGNLKVMYHGTPNGDFTVFKDGTYFTEHKWYADLYQNPGASSISTGKVASAPKTFEVYLDIKKPFDLNDPEARDIYINDYIKGGNAVGINPYLSDAEYDKITTIDWTEGEDLREFLIENGYDYDGLVLDEGAVGGYGEDVKQRGKSYVIFSPEQAKNVDNLNPTSDPDIRYSLSSTEEDISPRDIGPVREDVAPIQQNSVPPVTTDQFAPIGDNFAPEEHTAKILTEEPKVEDKKNSGWRKLVSNFFDKGSVFETLALNKNNRDLQGKYNMMHYSEGRAQRLIGKGAKGVKALTDIQSEVEKAGLTEKFYEYMYHKHNIDRMTLEERFGIPNKTVFGDSVTADVSREMVASLEAKAPELKKYAEDVYSFNKHLRKMLVDGGVISQKTADLWEKMYPHYVPVRRVGDTGLNVNVPLDTGRTGVNAPIKRAKGGSKNILPLFDTMAQRAIQTYKAVAKNSFGVELKNTLGTTIESDNANLDEVIDGIDKHEELLQEGKNGRNPTFTVFENGNRVTFEITKDMYDALKPTSEGLAYTNKALNKASNIHRGLLTEYNPVFMFTNAIKDAQDVFVNSQHARKTYLRMPKAIKELWNATQGKMGKWYTEYMENGGEQNTYFDNRKNTFEKEKSGLSKLIGMPLEWFSAANNFVERIPRLAEYIASREAGRSIETSMLDAARVTTNFAAGGDVTKFLNRNGATFLNASVQGFNQQVRNIREAKQNGLKGWMHLASKFAIAGLGAQLLNHLLWRDDEEYEELSDYVKQNYYVVAKTAGGQFVRIPKGRTLAVIQNAFEQIGNMMTGNDEADLNTFLELAISNLAPNNPIDNNIFAPIIQVANNKTWYGEDLVPTRLQDLPDAEQFDESTDAISKWLGETTGISPYKLNYLLNQYGGGVGDVFLPMLTPEAERGGDNTLFAPFTDKFTTDSVLNNQNVSDFYDTMDKLTKNAKSRKATEEDVLKYKFFNAVNAELGNLYQQKREVQNSSLSDQEKYSLIRSIHDEINAITRDSLDDYSGVSIDGPYATIGDLHYRYYTNEETGEAEWKKLNDKQLAAQEEVTSAFGITPSQYWSSKEEYDFAYEDPEKYAFLNENGFSYSDYENADEDDKRALTWAADNPGKFVFSKVVTGDLFEYRSITSNLNNIKADQDKNGKTISGSRKQKVLKYINSLGLSDGQKYILYKLQYPSDDTYDSKIISYLINHKDITREERKSILEQLGIAL